MNDLTPYAEEMCEAVEVFIGQQIMLTGFAPTIREIGAHLGLRSSSTTYHYVHLLEQMGRVEYNTARTVLKLVG